MSPPDDPPKKPPRASWEPPPAEPVRPPKPRAQTAPPRASWETPAEGVPVVTPKAPTAPTPAVAQAPRPSWETPATGTAPTPTSTPVVAAPRASWETPAEGTPVVTPATPTTSASWQPQTTSEPTSGSWQQAQPASWETAAAPTTSWTEPVSATSPIAAELPAPPPASVIVEQAGATSMTSASTISPAPPAEAMVDDPRLPTLPPEPPASAVADKPKKKPRTPPPELFEDDELDDGDGGGRKGGNRKLALIAALVGIVGLGIGALVWLGSINKERLLIACEPQQVIAKQGRGFPPWGERNIDDDGMWKPIKIPPDAECTPRETDDIHELSKWYLELLVDRASVALTAKEGATHDGKAIDEAFAMLEQALLHTRASDRREQRREIERLLGDVGYWRATGRLRDAAAALTEAAKQFDAAATQRPRHVSDANAWATHVRKLVEQLKAGPNGASAVFPPTPPTDRVPAPPGVALPVEPPKAGSGSAVEPAAPVDAGMPTGGVLL